MAPSLPNSLQFPWIFFETFLVTLTTIGQVSYTLSICDLTDIIKMFLFTFYGTNDANVTYQQKNPFNKH